MAAWHALEQIEYLGNSLADWLIALAIFLVTFPLLPLA